jgi:hypothetical protein
LVARHDEIFRIFWKSIKGCHADFHKGRRSSASSLPILSLVRVHLCLD